MSYIICLHTYISAHIISGMALGLICFQFFFPRVNSLRFSDPTPFESTATIIKPPVQTNKSIYFNYNYHLAHASVFQANIQHSKPSQSVFTVANYYWCWACATQHTYLQKIWSVCWGFVSAGLGGFRSVVCGCWFSFEINKFPVCHSIGRAYPRFHSLQISVWVLSGLRYQMGGDVLP